MTTQNAKNSQIKSEKWKSQIESAELTKKMIKMINSCEKECLADSGCKKCNFLQYGKNCYAAKLTMRIRKTFVIKEKNE